MVQMSFLLGFQPPDRCPHHLLPTPKGWPPRFHCHRSKPSGRKSTVAWMKFSPASPSKPKWATNTEKNMEKPWFPWSCCHFHIRIWLVHVKPHKNQPTFFVGLFLMCTPIPLHHNPAISRNSSVDSSKPWLCTALLRSSKKRFVAWRERAYLTKNGHGSSRIYPPWN